MTARAISLSDWMLLFGCLAPVLIGLAFIGWGLGDECGCDQCEPEDRQ